MRWLHADHASSKCDYQSSCRSVLYAVWPLNAIILLDIVGAILACVTVAISSIPTPELCPETKRQLVLQDMKEGYVVLKQTGASLLCSGLV